MYTCCVDQMGQSETLIEAIAIADPKGGLVAVHVLLIWPESCTMGAAFGAAAAFC